MARSLLSGDGQRSRAASRRRCSHPTRSVPGASFGFRVSGFRFRASVVQRSQEDSRSRCSRFMGSVRGASFGFRVSGFRFRFSGSVSRVWNLRCIVFRVQGSGCRASSQRSQEDSRPRCSRRTGSVRGGPHSRQNSSRNSRQNFRGCK
jgi:hypothetical protein